MRMSVRVEVDNTANLIHVWIEKKFDVESVEAAVALAAQKVLRSAP